MTPEERSNINNAIWLCSDHAKLIDRDEVTYSAEMIREMKRIHEEIVARSLRTRSNLSTPSGLIAIGRDIVCTGELVTVSADCWTFQLNHFLIGDLYGVTSFIDGFRKANQQSRYVLSGELGDGRTLLAAPTLAKQPDRCILLCPVATSADRIDARKLGADLALRRAIGDPSKDKKGGPALVHGIDALEQKVTNILSLQQGDSVFEPDFGVRFFEYFDAYGDSPWLDLLLKLEVIRQASIPFDDWLIGRRTPLQCVTKVNDLELLSRVPDKNRLPVRLSLEVQGVGTWQRDISIYMPTPAQMAERAAVLASAPQLSHLTRRVEDSAKVELRRLEPEEAKRLAKDMEKIFGVRSNPNHNKN